VDKKVAMPCDEGAEGKMEEWSLSFIGRHLLTMQNPYTLAGNVHFLIEISGVAQ